MVCGAILGMLVLMALSAGVGDAAKKESESAGDVAWGILAGNAIKESATLVELHVPADYTPHCVQLQRSREKYFGNTKTAEEIPLRYDPYVAYLTFEILNHAAKGALFAEYNDNVYIRPTCRIRDRNRWYIAVVRANESGVINKHLLWPHCGTTIEPVYGEDSKEVLWRDSILPGIENGDIIDLSIYAIPRQPGQVPENIDVNVVVDSGDAVLAIRIPVPVIVNSN